jgi:hypothetical protein
MNGFCCPVGRSVSDNACESSVSGHSGELVHALTVACMSSGVRCAVACTEYVPQLSPEFSAAIKAEILKWAKVIKDADVNLE